MKIFKVIKFVTRRYEVILSEESYGKAEVIAEAYEIEDMKEDYDYWDEDIIIIEEKEHEVCTCK